MGKRLDEGRLLTEAGSKVIDRYVLMEEKIQAETAQHVIKGAISTMEDCSKQLTKLFHELNALGTGKHKQWVLHSFSVESENGEPIIWDKRNPHWISESESESDEEGRVYKVFVYLPIDENPEYYWHNIFNMEEYEPVNEIEFNEDYPKPDWFIA